MCCLQAIVVTIHPFWSNCPRYLQLVFAIHPPPAPSALAICRSHPDKFFWVHHCEHLPPPSICWPVNVFCLCVLISHAKIRYVSTMISWISKSFLLMVQHFYLQSYLECVSRNARYRQERWSYLQAVPNQVVLLLGSPSM